MKNIKKPGLRVISVIITLAMLVMISGVYALAADTTADPNQSTIQITEIPVYKVLDTMEPGVVIPEISFYARMSPGMIMEDEEAISGIMPEEGHELVNDIVEFDFNENKDNSLGSVSSEGAFQMEFKEEFDHAGIYKYTIEEVVKNVTYDDDGNEIVSYDMTPMQTPDQTYYVIYDFVKYDVYLYVSEMKGKYVVTAVSAYSREDESKPDSIVFQNFISCAKIVIKKKVVGTEYTKDEDYQFCILIPEEGDTITLTAYDTIWAQKYDKNDNKIGDRFEITVAGKDINADAFLYGTRFTLKAGEYVVIDAPVSMIYKVMEVIPVAENYEITFEYSENGNYTDSLTAGVSLEEHSSYSKNEATGEESYVEIIDADTDQGYELLDLAWIKGTTNSGINTIIYTNTRNYKVPTGVRVDLIPYIAVVLITGAAVVTIIIVKHRKKEKQAYGKH